MSSMTSQFTVIKPHHGPYADLEERSIKTFYKALVYESLLVTANYKGACWGPPYPIGVHNACP